MVVHGAGRIIEYLYTKQPGLGRQSNGRLQSERNELNKEETNEPFSLNYDIAGDAATGSGADGEFTVISCGGAGAGHVHDHHICSKDQTLFSSWAVRKLLSRSARFT